MKSSEIQSILMDALPLQEVFVNSTTGSHFQVIAIGELFSEMNRVKRQQIVYMPLMTYIKDNHIHAISIKTYTPKEWELDCKLNINRGR